MDSDKEVKRLRKLLSKLSDKMNKLEDKVDKMNDSVDKIEYIERDMERMQEQQTKTDMDMLDLQIKIDDLRD